MILEYDGTEYHGWQVQPGRRTVQGTIEEHLACLLQEKVALISAGRTDAGVHALGLVANFHTSSDRPLERIEKGLNGVLPKDIAVRGIQEVPADFHARFDARARRYRYRIVPRRRISERSFLWVVHEKLELALMQEASACLIGTHDFTSFCAACSESNTRICSVTECRWSQQGEEIRLEIEANRFLHHMVRVIVGTMVDVGRGNLAPEEVIRILEAKDRRAGGRTAPAKGLTLVRVTY
ncbi:MAG: tRNA pseudouridine(38-40) synthase TruA [Candidatus Latescibacterota bacterium]